MICLGWLASARADFVTLRPVADTSLLATAPNNNLGGQSFFTAGTTQNNTYTRGLLRFDFTGQIPSDAVISSVNLQLEVTKQPADGYAISSFSLHLMLAPWGEGNKTAANPLSPGQGAPATSGEATWNAPYTGTAASWAAPGGKAGVDFLAAASASQVIYDLGSSPYNFASTPALVADVQAWVNHVTTNFGWMLQTDDEATPFTARRFGSREDATHAPLLTVEYTVVPEPTVLTLTALSALALLARPIRRQ